MPNQSYLELARHLAAVAPPDRWENMVALARQITHGLSLDDVDAVALAIERAEPILFELRRPAGVRLH